MKARLFCWFCITATLLNFVAAGYIEVGSLDVDNKETRKRPTSLTFTAELETSLGHGNTISIEATRELFEDKELYNCLNSRYSATINQPVGSNCTAEYELPTTRKELKITLSNSGPTCNLIAGLVNVTVTNEVCQPGFLSINKAYDSQLEANGDPLTFTMYTGTKPAQNPNGNEILSGFTLLKPQLTSPGIQVDTIYTRASPTVMAISATTSAVGALSAGDIITVTSTYNVFATEPASVSIFHGSHCTDDNAMTGQILSAKSLQVTLGSSCSIAALTAINISIRTDFATNSHTADSVVFTLNSTKDIDTTGPFVAYTLQRAQLTSTRLFPNSVQAGGPVASMTFGALTSSRGALVGGNTITVNTTSAIFNATSTPFQVSVLDHDHSGTACNRTIGTTTDTKLIVVLAPPGCDLTPSNTFTMKIEANIRPNVNFANTVNFTMVSTADFDVSDAVAGYTVVVPRLRDVSVSVDTIRISTTPTKMTVGATTSALGGLSAGHAIYMISQDDVFEVGYHVVTYKSGITGCAAGTPHYGNTSSKILHITLDTGCQILPSTQFQMEISSGLLANAAVGKDMIFKMNSTSDFIDTESVVGYSVVSPQLLAVTAEPNHPISLESPSYITFNATPSFFGELTDNSNITITAGRGIFTEQSTPFSLVLLSSTHTGSCAMQGTTTATRLSVQLSVSTNCVIPAGSPISFRILTNLAMNAGPGLVTFTINSSEDTVDATGSYTVLCNASTSDVSGVCKQNRCLCAGGVAATSTACTANFTNICVSCDSGFGLVGSACIQNTCTCANGTAATVSACLANNSNICVSCDIGFSVVERHCMPNKCVCANGDAAVSTACTLNNSNICRSCNDGYSLIDEVCVSNRCLCPNGTPSPLCLVNHTIDCIACNPGFQLVGKNCSSPSRVVRFGTFNRPGPFSLGFARKFFARTFFDSDVAFHYEYLSSGMEGLEKLVNGELDFCTLESPIIANALGRGIDVELVYPTVKPSAIATGCRMRRRSIRGTRIYQPKDVMYTRVAVPTQLSRSHMLLFLLSDIFRFDFSTIDVVFVEDPGLMKTMLEEGEIDGACASGTTFVDIQTVPNTFTFWDMEMLGKWRPIISSYVAVSGDYAREPKNVAILKHFLRVGTICNEDQVNNGHTSRWQEDGVFMQSIRNVVHGEPDAVKAGSALQALNVTLSCAGLADQHNKGKQYPCPESDTVLDVSDGYSFNIAAHLISNERFMYDPMMPSSLHGVVNMSFLSAVATEYDAFHNLTIETLLSLGPAPGISYSTPGPNCTVSNPSVVAVPNGGINRVFCKSRGMDSASTRTWSFKPLQSRSRLVVKPIAISLRAKFDMLVVTAHTANGGQRTILGVFRDRSWDAGYSSLPNRKVKSLPTMIAGVDEHIEVTFVSKPGGWHDRLADHFDLQIITRESTASCTTSAFNCSGHGTCVDNHGPECVCSKGYYGLHCTQAVCMGTTTVSVQSNIATIHSNAAAEYASYSNCSWKLQGSDDHAIEIVIDYDTETYYDTVSFFAGNVLRTRLSGRNKQRRLVFNDSSVMTVFSSDGVAAGAGFRLSHRLLEYTHLCHSSSASSSCSSHGSCVDHQCLCQPGWSGDACTVPFCSRDIVTLRKHKRRALQRFSSHHSEYTNSSYEKDATCAWTLEPINNTVGVRLHPQSSFKLHTGDTLNILYTSPRERTLHILQTDVVCDSHSQNMALEKCKEVNFSSSIIYHLLPPAGCAQSCYVDIIETVPGHSPWSTIEITFTSRMNSEGGGFDFEYQYIPLKTMADFVPVVPSNVRATLSDTGSFIRVRWTRDMSNVLHEKVDTVSGYKIRVCEDARDMRAPKVTAIVPPDAREWILSKDAVTEGRMYYVTVTTLFIAYEPYGDHGNASAGINESYPGEAARYGSACFPPHHSVNGTCCPVSQYYEDACFQCPFGAQCEGKRGVDMLPKEGFWRVKWVRGYSFASCPIEMACNSSKTNNGCRDGYDGPLCNSCIDGAAKRDRMCLSCQTDGAYTNMIVTLVACAVLYGVSHLKSRAGPVRRKWEAIFHAYNESSRAAAFRIFKTLYEFIQVSGLMTSALEMGGRNVMTANVLRIPENFGVFIAGFGVFNIDIFGIFALDCIGKLSPQSQVLVFGFTPFFVVAPFCIRYWQQTKEFEKTHRPAKQETVEFALDALSLQIEMTACTAGIDVSEKLSKDNLSKIVQAYDPEFSTFETDSIYKRIRRNTGGDIFLEHLVKALVDGKVPIDGWKLAKADRISRAWHSLTTICLTICLYFHTPVTFKLFSYFACHTIAIPGSVPRHIMALDSEYSCYDARWWSYFPIVLFVILIFSVGFPGLVMVTLWKFRKKLYTNSAIQKIGSIYEDRPTSCPWWEVFDMFRRFLLTVIVMLVENTNDKLAISVAVCTVSVGAVCRYQPHKKRLVFWVQLLAYMTTFMTFLLFSSTAVSLALPSERHVRERNIGQGAEAVGSLVIFLHYLVLLLAGMFALLGFQNVGERVNGENTKAFKKHLANHVKHVKLFSVFNGSSVPMKEGLEQQREDVKKEFGDIELTFNNPLQPTNRLGRSGVSGRRQSTRVTSKEIPAQNISRLPPRRNSVNLVSSPSTPSQSMSSTLRRASLNFTAETPRPGLQSSLSPTGVENERAKKKKKKRRESSKESGNRRSTLSKEQMALFMQS